LETTLRPRLALPRDLFQNSRSAFTSCNAACEAAAGKNKERVPAGIPKEEFSYVEKFGYVKNTSMAINKARIDTRAKGVC